MRVYLSTQLIKEAFQYWIDDKVPRMAAALAYYTAFSLAPLLFIAIGIAGLWFGQVEAQTRVLNQMKGLFGVEQAHQIKIMLENAAHPTSNIFVTLLGFIILLIGAMGMFGELQDDLNTIWGVQPKPNRTLHTIIKDRFFSLTMVLGLGFLLLVSLIFSTIVTAFANYFNHYFQGGEFIWFIMNFIFSIGFVALLFALIFKILPDVHIKWRDVYLSSFITALLFTLGKFLLELYLSHSSIASSYGAAGSFIVILLWVYYSAQILFFGAELTKVITLQHRSKIKPTRHAIVKEE